MKKKLFSLAIATTMIFGATGGVLAAEGVAQNVPFVNGYEDNTFRPDNTITRAEVSKMISEAYAIAQQQESFDDVADDHWAAGYIGGLEKNKVIEGYPGGLFKPEARITRAEFSAVIYRAMGDQGGSIPEDTFSDIDEHWGKTVILKLAKYGVVKGYSDNTFKPDSEITRAEAVTMILRSLNRNIDPKISSKVENPFTDLVEGAWYYENILGASTTYEYSISEGVETITEPEEMLKSAFFPNQIFYKIYMSGREELDYRVNNTAGRSLAEELRAAGYSKVFREIDSNGNEIPIESSSILDSKYGPEDGMLVLDPPAGVYKIKLDILKNGEVVYTDTADITIEAEESRRFNIYLRDGYKSEIELIKMYMALTGCTLQEAEDWLAQPKPALITENLTYQEALDLEDEFRSGGANTIITSYEYDVLLKDVGTRKIDVIKVIRAYTGYGLVKSKAYADNAPVTVAIKVKEADALDFQEALIQAGASVELKN